MPQKIHTHIDIVYARREFFSFWKTVGDHKIITPNMHAVKRCICRFICCCLYLCDAGDFYKCFVIALAGYCGSVCCYWASKRCFLYYRYSLLLWLVKFKSLIIIRHNMDDDDKSTPKTRAFDHHLHGNLYSDKKNRETLLANERSCGSVNIKKYAWATRWAKKRTGNHISVIYCIFLLIK